MDFNRPELIVALFAFTLLAVLAIGLWQKFSVKRSQQRDHHRPGAGDFGVDTAEHVREAHEQRR